MTKKTRMVLFLSLLVLFFLIVPLIVFYSQGYRYDFENKKITQTGGLFLKVVPRQVEIYIDNKLKKKTDFFFGSILIENLLPKKYKIEVKKEGYYPWEKSLEIKERQVTEAKNIILFPENPNFTVAATEKEEINNILSKINPKEEKNEKEIPKILPDDVLSYQIIQGKVIWLDKKGGFYQDDLEGKLPKELIAQNIKNFKISPDNKKIVYFNNYEIWILFLEADHVLAHQVGEKVFLTRFSEKINDILWLNSNYLVFNIGDKIKISEIDDRDRINIIDLVPPTTTGGGLEMFWNQVDKKLYILTESKLYRSETLF